MNIPPIAARTVAVGLAFALSQAGPAQARDALPLGDGRIAKSPRIGHVFSCQQRFNANAPGAQKAGDWIAGDRWFPSRKPTVGGAVSWASARVEIHRDGEWRVVSANNLPTHKTGKFPISRNDDAYRYDRNPNPIKAQKVLLRLPVEPELAGQPSCVPMGMIGVAVTGAAIYNALDARGKDAPAHEIQDACAGHPERSGQYHYHDLSDCLPDKRAQPGGHSDILGYALDGFAIFGRYGESGRVVTNADLDTCHGHAHAAEWDGEKREIYHYHFTAEYPYTIGCFRGKPVVAGQR